MTRRQIMAQVGDRIRNARIDNEISQAMLATEAGISTQAIWYFERGKRLPSLTTLFKIAEAVGVHPSALL